MSVPVDLVAGSPTPAAMPWDGAALIDSDGPYTDQLALTGGRLLFVYGAPTDLGLDAYAKAGQAQKAVWHDCPTTPDSMTETTFGGEAALEYVFDCGGRHTHSLYTVHDGFGLVVNLMNPLGDEATDAQVFKSAVSGGTWAD